MPPSNQRAKGGLLQSSTVWKGSNQCRCSRACRAPEAVGVGLHLGHEVAVGLHGADPSGGGQLRRRRKHATPRGARIRSWPQTSPWQQSGVHSELRRPDREEHPLAAAGTSSGAGARANQLPGIVYSTPGNRAVSGRAWGFWYLRTSKKVWFRVERGAVEGLQPVFTYNGRPILHWSELARRPAHSSRTDPPPGGVGALSSAAARPRVRRHRALPAALDPLDLAPSGGLRPGRSGSRWRSGSRRQPDEGAPLREWRHGPPRGLPVRSRRAPARHRTAARPGLAGGRQPLRPTPEPGRARQPAGPPPPGLRRAGAALDQRQPLRQPSAKPVGRTAGRAPAHRRGPAGAGASDARRPGAGAALPRAAASPWRWPPAAPKPRWPSKRAPHPWLERSTPAGLRRRSRAQRRQASSRPVPDGRPSGWGWPAADCWAFEDSLAGSQAALAAGCRVHVLLPDGARSGAAIQPGVRLPGAPSTRSLELAERKGGQ